MNDNITTYDSPKVPANRLTTALLHAANEGHISEAQIADLIDSLECATMSFAMEVADHDDGTEYINEPGRRVKLMRSGERLGYLLDSLSEWHAEQK